MQERCNNPNYRAYHRYGGRGIRVHSEWLDFDNFISDMGKKPTSKHQLDRINNDKDYTPDNCKWSTSKEQNNNRSNNRVVAINGIKNTISEWSRINKVSMGCIYDRIRLGWAIEKAVTVPPNPPGKTFTNGQAYRKNPVPKCNKCGNYTKGYRSKYCSKECYITARFHS